MNYATARQNMVASQVRPNSVRDVVLLDAMQSVPRESFVEETPFARALAYSDAEPVAGRTNTTGARRMMEPMVFAKLAQLASIGKEDLVLDIGCATGYSTAILSKMAGSVVAIECEETLAKRAGKNLADLGIDNAAVVEGELAKGHAEEGPYNAIFINGRVKEVPPAVFDQLADGGRVVAVVGEAQHATAHIYQRVDGEIVDTVAFDANASELTCL
jgi:protein-L-isoaspartate(D-aspartate) O-methyltransferase